MTAAERCTFDVAWQGECGDPAVESNPPRCREHADETCAVCGAPAIKQCHATRGLVCGRPLCDEHDINDCPHYW